MVKFIMVFGIIFMNSCAGFQGAIDDVEEIATDNAVTIQIQKEALRDDTNVKITVDVINEAAVNALH